MKQFKVKRTIHKKLEDIFIRARNEQDALDKVDLTITAGDKSKEESMTVTAEPIDPPSEKQATMEGQMCPTCRRFYTDPLEFEEMEHSGECMGCQQMRAELMEQRLADELP